jgi:hypothetical protein
MLTLWGKGGYGGSPNVEAEKKDPHTRIKPLDLASGHGRCIICYITVKDLQYTRTNT